MSPNGGQSWQRDDLLASGGDLTAVSCANAADCWAVGYAGTDDESPVIEATSDGGMHWAAQTPPAAVQGLVAISCPSTTDCLAVAETGSGSAIIGTVGDALGDPGSPVGYPALERHLLRLRA